MLGERSWGQQNKFVISLGSVKLHHKFHAVATYAGHRQTDRGIPITFYVKVEKIKKKIYNHSNSLVGSINVRNRAD